MRRTFCTIRYETGEDRTNVLSSMAMKLDLSQKRTTTQLVLSTVISCISQQHGRKVHFKVPRGGKMEVNCNRLYVFAREREVPLRELINDILDMYGVDFCMRVFKTPYPQINVILSDKTFERVRTANKKPVKVKKKDAMSIAKVYIDAMQDVDYDTAKACVEGGWPEGPQYVRNEILLSLKRRHDARGGKDKLDDLSRS